MEPYNEPKRDIKMPKVGETAEFELISAVKATLKELIPSPEQRAKFTKATDDSLFIRVALMNKSWGETSEMIRYHGDNPHFKSIQARWTAAWGFVAGTMVSYRWAASENKPGEYEWKVNL